MPRKILVTARRDISTVWQSVNPMLGNGEIAYEIDSGKAKLGDGVTPWNSLRYLSDILHDNVVANRMLRDSTALSVIGRSASTTGDPGDITSSQDFQTLRRSGSSLGFGQVATEGFADQAVTSAKILDEAISDVHVNSSAGISPSKLGPGFLRDVTKASTPNYVDDSITTDKLNNQPNDEGVGVWRDYPIKMYVAFPKFYYARYRTNTVFGPVGDGTIGFNPPGPSREQLQTVNQLNWSLYSFWWPRRRRFYYYWQTIDDDDEGREFPGIEIFYAKYCVINKTCYVNALVRMTNSMQFQATAFFSLPKTPAVPEFTSIGSAYQLNSWDPRNNPALRAIYLEDDKVGFFGHRYPRYFGWSWYGWYWFEGWRSYHYNIFRFPDRVSFNLRYEIE